MKQDTQDHAQPVELPGVSRRSLLKLAAVGTLGIAAGIGTANRIAHWIHTEPATYQFFSEAEARLLIAICEQIIPRDDTAGATDAGVIFYVDRQLASVFIRHQQTYRLGLESFRKTCLQVYTVSFEQLAFGRQTEALRLIESNKAPKEFWGGRSQSAFFNLVLDHTRQGFYGSPRHGGNRDYLSYRMLGLAYPNLIGQNRYAAGQPV
jgi:gluconate 2-dehydrogenase gamma chain